MMKTQYMLCMLCCIILSVLGMTVNADEASDDYSLYLEVMKRLESLTPGDAIDVRMGTEKEEYVVGDSFEVRFMVSDACHMVLMDIGAARKDTVTTDMMYGAITFLVPNYKVLENKVEAGRVYSSLYDFDMKIKVAPPAGFETVNLFCSSQPFALFDADFTRDKIYTIEPHETEKLQKLLDQLDHLEQQEWAGSSVSFLIKEPGITARPLPKKFGALRPMGGTGTTGKFFPAIDAGNP
jgi:hypothetical protein